MYQRAGKDAARAEGAERTGPATAPARDTRPVGARARRAGRPRRASVKRKGGLSALAGRLGRYLITGRRAVQGHSTPREPARAAPARLSGCQRPRGTGQRARFFPRPCPAPRPRAEESVAPQEEAPLPRPGPDPAHALRAGPRRPGPLRRATPPLQRSGGRALSPGDVTPAPAPGGTPQSAGGGPLPGPAARTAGPGAATPREGRNRDHVGSFQGAPGAGDGPGPRRTVRGPVNGFRFLLFAFPSPTPLRMNLEPQPRTRLALHRTQKTNMVKPWTTQKTLAVLQSFFFL